MPRDTCASSLRTVARWIGGWLLASSIACGSAASRTASPATDPASPREETEPADDSPGDRPEPRQPHADADADGGVEVDRDPCALVVHETRSRRPPRTLRDVLAATELVTLGARSFGATDCSSVGHSHVVFTRDDATFPDEEIAGEAIDAYARRSSHGATSALPRAPYYLIGARRRPRRRLDLRSVCIPRRPRVDANVEWVVPLADMDEVRAFSARLATGALCDAGARAVEGHGSEDLGGEH